MTLLEVLDSFECIVVWNQLIDHFGVEFALKTLEDELVRTNGSCSDLAPLLEVGANECERLGAAADEWMIEVGSRSTDAMFDSGLRLQDVDDAEGCEVESEATEPMTEVGGVAGEGKRIGRIVR